MNNLNHLTGVPLSDSRHEETLNSSSCPWLKIQPSESPVQPFKRWTLDEKIKQTTSEMHRHRVYFVRHGESEWNKFNLFCGWNDVNLSEKGEQDALHVSAAYLQKVNVKFDIAFTSALKRSEQTAKIILNALHCSSIPILSSWRLNERHYGALIGFNKRQMADMYGEEQVQIWRRSYNVPPPPITPVNPYYHPIRNNPKFQSIPDEHFPDTETLESTIKRVLPYWTECIVPEIRSGKQCLIVAHGTSLRGLVKHIECMSESEIMKFNLPNGIPFYYEFDETMRPMSGIKFLADDKTVLRAMEKVASIGK